MNGCAAIFTGIYSGSTEIDPGDPETEVVVDGESQGKGKVLVDLNEESGKVRQIELRKNGYKPVHYTTHKGKTSAPEVMGYVFDFLLPLGVLGAVSDGGLPPTEVTYTALGGLGVFYYDRALVDKSYPSGFELSPPDQTLPEGGQEVKKEIFVGNVFLDLDKEDPIASFYKNRRKLENRRPFRSFDVSQLEDISGTMNTVIRDSLNRILDSLDYLEIPDRSSENELTLNNYNLLKIVPTIEKMHSRYVTQEGYMLTDIEVNCQVVNNFGDTLLSKTYTKTSGEFRSGLGIGMTGYDSFDSDELANNVITDGMYSTIIALLKEKKIKEQLKKDEFGEEKKKRADWETITLKRGDMTDRGEEKGMSGEIKSMVTIKRDKSHGSGCIISSDGYIVTNQHVVRQQDSTEILFSDQKSARGRVVRRSKVADLALLKLDTSGLRPLELLGPDEEVGIGQSAIAIGTPENISLSQTVSQGIISGKREFNRIPYLQTDVSINPGNSGGGLLNEAGTLVGITNAKIKGADVEGLSFAIPVDIVYEYLKLAPE